MTVPSKSSPDVGSRWRHPRLRGTWRVDTVGRRWITLRSETVVLRGGAWATERVALVNWQGLWEAA